MERNDDYGLNENEVFIYRVAKVILQEQKEIRGCDTDPQYCWARLAQIIGDEFSKTGNNDLSLGIGSVSHLDCHNYDNGVYYIDNEFNIVDHTDGSELE